MTIHDLYAKKQFYNLRMVESPLGSPERITWIGIVREIERAIKSALVASTTKGV